MSARCYTSAGGAQGMSAARNRSPGAGASRLDAGNYLAREQLDHVDLLEQRVVQHDPLHADGRVLGEPLGRALGRSDDAVLGDVGEVVVERTGARIEAPRAFHSLAELVLVGAEVEPRHERRDERRLITALRVDRLAYAFEPASDLGGCAADRVELVRPPSREPRDPRSSLPPEDDGRMRLL